MEQKRQETTALSQKRYAIARCIKYVQLLLMILILFLPTLHFTSESKELRMEVSSSVSVFQYLIGDTATEIQIKETGKTGTENSFIGALLQNISVDVPRELFADNESLFVGFRIAPILVGLIIGLVCAFSSRTLSNTTNALTSTRAMIRQIQNAQQTTQNPAQTHLNNQMYITRVYNTLPRFFDFLEKFLFGTIFVTYFMFCTIAVAQMVGAIDTVDFEWTFHLVYPIIALIILIFFVNGGVIHIVCSKDFYIIRSTGARLEDCYEHPTIFSDIKAISSLFQPNQTKSFISEEAKIEVLQKYKSLLDQGVITKEEYEAKKAELLNQKNDNI